MPTKFETLSMELYATAFEPDSERQKMAIETWFNRAIEVLQAAVETELRSYLSNYLERLTTEEGRQSIARKFRNNMEKYWLSMEIRLTPLYPSRNITVHTVEPASSEMRATTIQAYDNMLSRIEAAETAKLVALREEALSNTNPASVSSETHDDGGDWSEDSSPGRLPNDDRSDAMNPNNDAYQSAMDNHSNQMNPNNDAYWSSRGR
ncbi:MAG: hypothetical protein HY533_06075 [Chloroflexi bacterium]|nr:hypothetical protein [Chloroflexota bacterium]